MSVEKWIEKLERVQILTEKELKSLCRLAIEILAQEPNVLELSGCQHIIGDIHGQFHDLKNIIHCIVPKMGETSYVFLGDYVDRGYYSVETISLLLAYKCKYPKTVILLRGNHETRSLTKIYGFFDEAMKKYGNSEPWNCITEVFHYLPLAAVIQSKILCIHGGLSPSIPFIDDISNIDRVQEIPESGPLGDLVWSDPDKDVPGWTVSNRGAGYLFNHAITVSFNALNSLETVVRAHQLVEEGHIYNFGDQSLVTVWSAPNYCYRCGNGAALMKVEESGETGFIDFNEAPENSSNNVNYEYVLPYFL